MTDKTKLTSMGRTREECGRLIAQSLMDMAVAGNSVEMLASEGWSGEPEITVETCGISYPARGQLKAAFSDGMGNDYEITFIRRTK